MDDKEGQDLQFVTVAMLIVFPMHIFFAKLHLSIYLWRINLNCPLFLNFDGTKTEDVRLGFFLWLFLCLEC